MYLWIYLTYENTFLFLICGVEFIGVVLQEKYAFLVAITFLFTRLFTFNNDILVSFALREEIIH